MKFSIQFTIQRLLVALIILFIFAFLPIIPVKNQVQCIREPCPAIDTILAPFQIFAPNIILTSWSFIALLLELIVSYLLACFLTMKTKDFYP